MCSSLFILSCVFLPLLVLCVKRDVPLLVPHDSLGCCPLTPYDVEERSMKNRCSLHEAIRTIPWHSLVLFLGMEIWWTMVFGGPWVFEPGHRNSQWERLRKGSLSCQNMKHHYPTPRPPHHPARPLYSLNWGPLLIQPWGRSSAFPTSWSMEAAFTEPFPTPFIFFDLGCAQGSVGQLQGDFFVLVIWKIPPWECFVRCKGHTASSHCDSRRALFRQISSK